MYRDLALCAAVLGLWGCRELPTETLPDSRIDATLAAAVAPVPRLACTRHWANGVDGDWNDPSRWSPVGTPTTADIVCIDASGSYTVRGDTAWMDARGVEVGGPGARVVFEHRNLGVGVFADTILIRSGSTLVSFSASADLLHNEGAIHWPGRCSIHTGFSPASSVVNRGSMVFADTATIVQARVENFGSLHVEGVNNGTIELGGDVGLRTRFVNDGRILSATGSQLRLSGSTAAFHASPGSTWSGIGTRLLLDSATLSGTGMVGAVVATAATIQPGSPYGTLYTGTLVLDANSRIEIEIADTIAVRYDRIDVTGDASVDGDLRVTTVAPFQGGTCGQLLPVMRSTGILQGNFGTVNGLAQAPQRAWRVHNAPNAVELVGYRPGNRITVDGGTPTVEEGAVSATYRMCMGTAAPTALVVVSPTGTMGELEAFTPVTFDLADWALPRTVRVAALDDSDVEGVHSDTITHTVTTTDATYAATTVPRVPVVVLDNDGTADLSLIRLAQEDNQFVGDTMHTTFRVANAGPNASTGSSVVSLPLVGLEYLSATGATCAVDGSGALRCTLGAIDAGAQLDFEIRFRGAVVGLHTNTLTVSGQQLDPDPSNDTVVYTQRIN